MYMIDHQTQAKYCDFVLRSIDTENGKIYQIVYCIIKNVESVNRPLINMITDVSFESSYPHTDFVFGQIYIRKAEMRFKKRKIFF